jgi:hypothetical protein
MTLSFKRTHVIARLAVLIAFTLAIQMAGFPQPITGPVINALLFSTTILLGWIPGIILGIATPLVAIIRGQLPAPLIPMVPFICSGNALLVTFFYLLSAKRFRNNRNAPWRQTNLYIGIVLSSIIKFLWLTGTVYVILPKVLAHRLPNPLIYVMTLPQLITALVGGVMALIFIEILTRSGYEF